MLCQTYDVERPCVLVGATALDTIMIALAVSQARERASVRALRAKDTIVVEPTPIPEDVTPYDWTDVFTVTTIGTVVGAVVGILAGLWIAL